MSQSKTRAFNGELVIPAGSHPAVFGEPRLVISSRYARPLSRPRKPLLLQWIKPQPPDLFPHRPSWSSCSDGGLLRLRRCSLNGEGAWLGNSGCMRENFEPFRSLSILVANGASYMLGNNSWVGFLDSCIVVSIMCSFIILNTIAAFTAILVALLSHIMKAANLMLFLGWFENNIYSLLVVAHIAWSNQIIELLQPEVAFGLHKHLIYGRWTFQCSTMWNYFLL